MKCGLLLIRRKINTGFGSPKSIVIPGEEEKEYANLLDANFGSPFYETTWTSLTSTRTQVLNYETIIEAKKILIDKNQKLQVSLKNKKFSNPFIVHQFLGKNSIISIENISKEKFTIVNNTNYSGEVFYTASETIQALNNIDTDFDTFSDLFELIQGTNPYVKYI